MFYWIMKRLLIAPLTNLLFRPWVKGMDNIPAEGGAILASNHLSVSDSIFLPVAVDRPVVFLAKMEYFTGKGIKGKLTALFFRLSNQLPMDRSGGAASANSLGAGEQALLDGNLLGIYPEGTRSPDGRLYRGKVGVAKLALATGVPVIPVAMIGTDKVQPIGKTVPNIRRVGLIVGEPLDFSRYEGMEDDRFVQRSVTDEIMYALMRLSGQEYVDSYAASVKARITADRLAERKAAREALAENARAQVRATVDAAKKEVEHIRTPKDGADGDTTEEPPAAEQTTGTGQADDDDAPSDTGLPGDPGKNGNSNPA
ncbi:MAG: lysophospholipid acyltransferase family protein [Arthrobacter sp.]|uniref:lysophospholipid acyltransferase family protein n=1 Tax=unclassified Arthrobacter TaxID=235627 RepID=UPI002652412E|nr:1-acyl-sn-glycerol-3-phosphate acyltransferase [Micrococcaceae bacterium]MDN5813182.1 1-acyl-sn-glycerol-3-phosphate acyltransferase [Micrococcaceae bacterium]MDN5824700.1 1-acyl-sn-glycerol-3-phosphate acyltransferase [Micrococcaceae bacterium]MDN5878297.1 1-acyl-sn-glycerol-3-phosphate acyltransferase [Micrococcaceae bacterium]MDN5886447.1 1-acyl-sn-glycerol-3-phosphate acyltransferase [Micrococcaceae bacterium]